MPPPHHRPDLGPLGWLRERPMMADCLLAVLIGAVSMIISVTVTNDESLVAQGARAPSDPLDWILAVGPAAAISVRRRWPVGAATVGAVAQMVLWTASQPDFYLAMGVLLYSAAAHGRTRGRNWAVAISVVLVGYTGLGWLSGEAPFYAVVIVSLFSAAAVSAGANVAARQIHLSTIEARAREAERATTNEQAKAVSEERNRIARELHDVVAHGLSVIVVQAAAAQRILDHDTETARDALGQIEETGRTALTEMRQVLNALRTDPEEAWRPAPGLAAVSELIADLAATGLQVTLEERGPAPPVPLPATVDLTAYRIVQEALTNVLKHGGPSARASVVVDHLPDALSLTVCDNGRGASAADSGGHGLRGMRERVEVFGGRFIAGPRPGGGYNVSVTLPVDGNRPVDTNRSAGTGATS